MQRVGRNKRALGFSYARPELGRQRIAEDAALRQRLPRLWVLQFRSAVVGAAVGLDDRIRTVAVLKLDNVCAVTVPARNMSALKPLRALALGIDLVTLAKREGT